MDRIMSKNIALESKGYIIWVDLEMTGLDIATDHIIEIAVLITDHTLNQCVEGPEIVVHQPDHILDGMDKWNTKHHGESGLTDRVRASMTTLAEAEQRIMSFVNPFLKEKNIPAGKIPLGGNSVHQDRLFIAKYLPAFNSALHYRNIDVSTVKELVKRWYPDMVKQLPKKKSAHRALDDIQASIDELKYYQKNCFLQV